MQLSKGNKKLIVNDQESDHNNKTLPEKNNSKIIISKIAVIQVHR